MIYKFQKTKPCTDRCQKTSQEGFGGPPDNGDTAATCAVFVRNHRWALPRASRQADFLLLASLKEKSRMRSRQPPGYTETSFHKFTRSRAVDYGDCRFDDRLRNFAVFYNWSIKLGFATSNCRFDALNSLFGLHFSLTASRQICRACTAPLRFHTIL
jgi:hypothetical protein